MTDFVFFLGRFHVLALHLPIGILLLAVILEVVARRPRFRYLQPALPALWLAGAISAVLTVMLGMMHAAEGGFSDSALSAHRTSALTLTTLAFVIWLLRVKWQSFYQHSWAVLSIAMLALLVLTGHYGGNLTHGETYLVEYAPKPLQSLFGLSAESLPRPKPADFASADIYLDIVAPAFRQRCGTCHNDSKRKGELSLANYASIMAGGKDGAVIVPGDTDASDLFRRITLAPSHEDFMPADGKTPLTEEQVQAIGWWIDAGAPASAAMASLDVPEPMQALLKNLLALDEATGENAAPSALDQLSATLTSADPELLVELESNGFVLRNIAADNSLLDVDFTAARDITEQDLNALAQVKDNVYALNLHRANLTDDLLALVGNFVNLHRLRIELNPVTDQGAQHLAQLKQLEYLNVYGTDIGDEGLKQLSKLENLHTLFVWQTKVTQDGIDAFLLERPNISFDDGIRRAELPPSPESVPIVN